MCPAVWQFDAYLIQVRLTCASVSRSLLLNLVYVCVCVRLSLTVLQYNPFIVWVSHLLSRPSNFTLPTQKGWVEIRVTICKVFETYITYTQIYIPKIISHNWFWLTKRYWLFHSKASLYLFVCLFVNAVWPVPYLPLVPVVLAVQEDPDHNTNTITKSISNMSFWVIAQTIVKSQCKRLKVTVHLKKKENSVIIHSP